MFTSKRIMEIENKNLIFNKKSSLISGLIASLVFGYLGFSLTKKIKNLQ
jgi:hypothetical protein